MDRAGRPAEHLRRLQGQRLQLRAVDSWDASVRKGCLHPLHPLLAALLEAWRAETPYGKDEDFIFPSFRLKGRKPPRANMLVTDHLQPAARKAGIQGRVGFHTLRRTLASALVAKGSDPKLVQELLRHSNIKTTLDVYARAMTPAKLEAQGWVLQQLLTRNAKSTVM